jgi:flavodoxin
MKETLEKAAERLSKDAYKKHSLKDDTFSLDEQIQRRGGFIVGFTEGLKEGAKWQAERMYSEEEVLDILFELSCNNDTDKEEVEEWFEQFKKK